MFVESTKCTRNLTLIHKSEQTIAIPNCRRVKLSQAIQEARERTRSHSAHPHTDTHTLTQIQLAESFTQREPKAKAAAATGERVVPHSSRVSWALDVLVSGCLWCSVRSKCDRRSSDVISVLVPVFVLMCVCMCVPVCWVWSFLLDLFRLSFFIHFFGCGLCLLENLKIKSILQLQCVCVCLTVCCSCLLKRFLPSV